MLKGKQTKCYSANGEDYLLWHFFDFKKNGTYLDVGAFDGVHFSNTYSFEIGGWQGVCVEPNPTYFSYLKQNRPAARCLQAACVSNLNESEATLYCEELGLLSTTHKSPGYENFVAERYKKRGLLFSGIKTATVPAITVDEIVRRYFPGNINIDLVSIDVEGAEMDVLRGFDVKRHKPGIIVIESNHPEQSEEMVEYFASRHGYLYAGTLVENLFFVKTKTEAMKVREIQIDCAIEAQLHPLGERFTAEPYRKEKIVKSRVLQKLK